MKRARRDSASYVPRTARELAEGVLYRTETESSYATVLLSSLLAHDSYLNHADRGLATELVYGVLRQRRRIDHVLSQHSARPIEKTDLVVLTALRVAAYQLLFLDRVPAYAAVDEAVRSVYRRRGKLLSGFANAVLRRIRPTDLDANLPDDGIRRLAMETSLPDDLAKQWVRELGEDEARRFAESLLQRAPLTLRANSLRGMSRDMLADRLVEEGLVVEFGSLSPEALSLTSATMPFHLPSYRQGLWTVQDEAAQLVGMLVDPKPGELILDACAGLGGKSTHLAALSTNRARIVSLDTNASKLELLRQHCERLGANCEAQQCDFTDRACLQELKFDRILVDAPCSGWGVFRRHPEGKWRWNASRRDELVTLQRALLQNAMAHLKPGGVLVYAVCTVSDAEGPDQRRWLLEQYRDLKLDRVSDAPWSELASTRDSEVRLWPHRHGTDGFYMARFRRDERSPRVEKTG